MTIDRLIDLAFEYGRLFGVDTSDIIHFLEWVSSVSKHNG